MARTGKKQAWMGLMATGATMALGSSALACVTFTGKMVVKGNRGIGEVTNVGNGQGMGFCAGYPLGKAKATLGGSVTVTVSKNPKEACNPGVRLPEGTYVVSYAVTGAFTRSDPTDKSNVDGTRQRVTNCNPSVGVNVRPIGTMSVDSLGKGTGTFTLPSDFGTVSGPTDEAAICVLDEFLEGNVGNQAPL
ncbi:MAG: hypothetical protein ABIS21_02985, partial [Acidimicrobiales bacterium]